MMLGRFGGLGKNPSAADAHDAGPVWGPWQNPSPADAHDAAGSGCLGADSGAYSKASPTDFHVRFGSKPSPADATDLSETSIVLYTLLS